MSLARQDAVPTYVVYAASLVVGLMIWEVAALQLPRIIFAPPSVVAVELYNGFASGKLVVAFAGSLAHLVLAFVPFMIIWFGLFFEARVALVFLMSFIEIMVTVSAGARGIEQSYLDVARAFGARGRDALVKVMFPAVLPCVFTALRIGLVRAIHAMIVAELFFASANLGRVM